MTRSAARHASDGGRRDVRRRQLGAVFSLVALVAVAACSSTDADSPADWTDEQLLAGLLTVEDLGEQYTERGRGADLFTTDEDGPRVVGEDPECQEHFDEGPEHAAGLTPDVSVVLAAAEPVGGFVESIQVGDREQTLDLARVALDCYRLGFTLDWGSVDGDSAEREPTTWTTTPVDLTVPGWQIVAHHTQSATDEPVGESGSVTAGRDDLVVTINIDAEAVPRDLMQTLTSTALQRVDVELLSSG